MSQREREADLGRAELFVAVLYAITLITAIVVI